ncbi:hypothetical protein TcBrA4_0112030 [Trypanosoma cruzi]|nr:hypothetical protein TcBrA4_0112030 [Trypanosoma cruzi]
MAKGKKSGEAKGTQKRQKKILRENVRGITRVHPPPGAPWRREAHLRRHLRRGAWRDQVVRGGRRARRHGVHGVLPQEDRHGRGRRERAVLYGYA